MGPDGKADASTATNTVPCKCVESPGWLCPEKGWSNSSPDRGGRKEISILKMKKLRPIEVKEWVGGWSG